MTTAPIGPVTPVVELRFHPTDLDPSLLHEATRRLGSPSEAIEAALLMARISVMTIAKEEVAKLTGEMSRAKLVGIADFAWQLYAPKFVRALGPVFADQYLRTMKAAGAGEIPMSTVYALAEQHASRVGTYYHESSRDALLTGFDTFVNRRLTARVAADRVLDGYGLTARGMNGYTSRSMDKAATVTPMNLRQRVLDYIGTSIRRRSKVFATQEAHNLDQQAEQIAWMWLQSKGELTAAAEKVWMTAKDERVCKQCGPMHNVRVSLTDRFTLPNGTQLYVPGAHPNCRCQARLLDHPYKATGSSAELSKAEWNSKEHPRGGDPENPGRFSVKARSTARQAAARGRPVAEKEAPDLSTLQAFLDQAAAQETAQVEEPKVVIGADRPKVVIGTPSSKVVIGEAPKVVIGEEPKVVIDEEPQKVVIGEEQTTEKVVIGDAAVQPGLTIRASPQQKMTVYGAPAEKVRIAEAPAPVEPEPPRPTPVRRRETIRLDLPDGPGAMYHIPSQYQLYDAADGDLGMELTRINLNTEMEFGQIQTRPQETQEEAFYREAKEALGNQVQSEADGFYENEENYLEKTLDDGTRVRAIVPEEELVDVMAVVAEGLEGSRYDRELNLEWVVHMPGTPHHGAPIGEREHIKLSEIASRWGVTEDNFTVNVLKLTEGHDSELGKTIEVQAADRYGPGTWAGTGLYELVEYRPPFVPPDEANYPIHFYELRPEGVETTEHDPPGWRPDLPE